MRAARLGYPLAMLRVLLAGALLLLPGCSFHQTARNWNGRTGPDGVPVYYSVTSKVALRLFVVIPLAGDVDIAQMVEELTEHVAEQGGDRVQIVQGNIENYWYGFPPLTWIVTPVISTLTATWEPPPRLLEIDAARGARPTNGS